MAVVLRMVASSACWVCDNETPHADVSDRFTFISCATRPDGQTHPPAAAPPGAGRAPAAPRRAAAAGGVLAIGGAQLALLALGRRYEEDFNNFHDFEHLPGVLLLAIRLGLAALFLWALRRSRRVEKQREVLEFLFSLAVFGSAWFLCLPLLVLVALVLPPYHRHQVVAGGSVVVQALTLICLSALFREGSQYYKMSSLAHVGSNFAMGSVWQQRGRTKLAVD